MMIPPPLNNNNKGLCTKLTTLDIYNLAKAIPISNLSCLVIGGASDINCSIVYNTVKLVTMDG